MTHSIQLHINTVSVVYKVSAHLRHASFIGFVGNKKVTGCSNIINVSYLFYQRFVRNTYFGSVTLTIPDETISTDFPQNLFFHLWSEQTFMSIFHLETSKLHQTSSHQNNVKFLPCQKVKFSDSAWQADRGGWWLTYTTQVKNKSFSDIIMKNLQQI